MPLEQFCSSLRSKIEALARKCESKKETTSEQRLVDGAVKQITMEESFCSRLTSVEILAEKVPACIAEVRTWWDAELIHIDNRPACRSAFVGRTPIGGKCTSNLQCPSGSYCTDPKSEDPLAWEKTCSAVIATGTPCKEHSGNTCGPDFHCAEGKCAPRPGAGGICTPDLQNCAPKLTCLLEKSTDKQGKCAPRRKAGEACHRWTECEGACVTTAKTKLDGTCESFCGSE